MASFGREPTIKENKNRIIKIDLKIDQLKAELEFLKNERTELSYKI